MNRLKAIAGLCVAAAVIGGAGCAVLGGGTSDAVVPVDLTGNWTLNAAESSDTARATVRALGRGVRAVPDPAGTATRTGGSDPERMRTARVNGKLAARVLAAARTAFEQITIADSAGVITFRSNAHSTGVAVMPDGRRARRTWLDGTNVQLHARWVQQRLEIVRRLEDGITVQEYYSRSPGGSRLVVFTIVHGPFDGELTMRRVYDFATD